MHSRYDALGPSWIQHSDWMGILHWAASLLSSLSAIAWLSPWCHSCPNITAMGEATIGESAVFGRGREEGESNISVAVSCGYSTCMSCGQCLWWAMPPQSWIELKHHSGFNRSCQPLSDTLLAGAWFFLRSRKWSIQLASSSSYLPVNMGCALAVVFQVRSHYVP